MSGKRRETDVNRTTSDAMSSTRCKVVFFSAKMRYVQNVPTPDRSNAKRTRKRRGRSESGVTEGGFFRYVPSEEV